MKIKSKLFVSGAITVIGIAVILGVSLVGMRLVERNLAILTERSTPQQLKSIELQRSLQEYAAALLKLPTVQTVGDLSAATSEAEKSASDVSRLESELEAFTGPRSANDEVTELLRAITSEALDATAERLQVEDATRAADATVKTRLQDIDHRLDGLSRSMNALQNMAARQLLAASQSAQQITQDLMDMTVARDLLKDIIFAIAEVQKAESRKALLVARSRLDTAFSKFARNRLVIAADPSVRAVDKLVAEVRHLAGGADGLLELKGALIAGTGSDDLRQRYEQHVQELEGRLTVAMATLAQEITLASAAYTHQTTSHDASLRNSIAASDTVALSGQLTSLGLDIGMWSQNMLGAGTIIDLERSAWQLGQAFLASAAVHRRLEEALVTQSRPEVKLLKGIGNALAEIKQLLLADRGVVDQLREGLAVKQKAQQLNERVLAVVALQREHSRQGISAAQSEQEMAVRSVRQMVERSVATVTAVGLTVLIFAIVVGVLIIRAISKPTASLVRVMARVSQEGDYAARAAIDSSDEIGELARGFNVMLEQIQDRDRRLAEHRDELETEVELRTAELRKARDLAEAGSRAKSEFLATMSHEIRTPMNGILGMTELLRHTALSAQQQRFADAVYQSGEHLLAIINDILDFSKIEAGKLDIERIDFNLRQLVEDLGCLFAQPAEAKGLEMVCSVPHDLPVAVSGDPVRVRQILTNLVNNAVKFTSHGDVVIRVRLLDENPQQARFRFEVQDSGIGISEEAQARLFCAFVQADSSTTRRFGGSGLGLAIAKRLVELMHGQIGLHSEAGRGTLFWFELPLLKQDPDARSVVNMAERLSGLRVLVVDDNATNREILAHQLEGWAMHCTGAADGQQALQQLQQSATRPFDLAILDLHMPGMDGFELARAIRCDARWTAKPLVMLSSVSVGADHPDRRSAPIDYYLTKPVRQSDLYDAIATAMSHHALRPAVAQPLSAPSLVAEVPPVRLGGRVLVAEDNPVNQQVAGAMLESLGVAYSLADNGKIALERVLHESFDLVLMDCQMPEMDGFEATAQIRTRQREGLLRHQVPIVALTANAVEGDRERCLAAGMDDYLSKPFTRERLAATLQRWLPRTDAAPVDAKATSSATGSAQARNASASATDEPINPRALDAIRHLPGPNGALLVQKVIGAFLADTPPRFAQLQSAVNAGNAEALRKAAHTLKSSSANVGAEHLAGLCKELELLGRKATVDGAKTLLLDVESELPRVLATLQTMINRSSNHAIA
jgi:signal transduction histidine kinase/DNA-binding response OmpR family regulator